MARVNVNILGISELDGLEWGNLTQMTIISGFLNHSVGEESVCNLGDPGSIPGWGRSTGGGIVYPLLILGLPLWLSW